MNTGILLPHLGQSQAAFLTISHINKLIMGGSNDDYVLFYNEVMPIREKPLCAMMNSSEIWGFEGVLICTTLLDADRVLKVQHAARKVLYLQDLEWYNNINIEWAGEILCNPNLIVVARSDNHAREIFKYCGVKPKVVRNFNIGLINECI